MGVAFATIRHPAYWGALVVLAAISLASASLEPRGDRALQAPPPAVTEPLRPSPTPGPNAVLRDSRRQLDLATITKALEGYRETRGAYPTTGGPADTLCAEAGDAGCGLRSLVSDLPTGDGESDYWYASDGESFTLLARVEIAPPEDNCGNAVPSELAGATVFCLVSEEDR